jgi:hypothetical protein
MNSTPPSSSEKKKEIGTASELQLTLTADARPTSTRTGTSLDPEAREVLARLEKVQSGRYSTWEEREALQRPLVISREHWEALCYALSTQSGYSKIWTFLSSKLKTSYYPLLQLFTPRMPTPVHEFAAKAFGKLVELELDKLREQFPQSNLQRVQWSGSTSIKLGAGGGSKRKLPLGGDKGHRDPDDSWIYDAYHEDSYRRKCHRVVLEVAFSETSDTLQYAIDQYFDDSRTAPRTVIAIEVDYKKPKVDGEERPIHVTIFRLQAELGNWSTVATDDLGRVDRDSSEFLSLKISDFIPNNELPPLLASSTEIKVSTAKFVAMVRSGEEKYDSEKERERQYEMKDDLALESDSDTPPVKVSVERPRRWVEAGEEEQRPLKLVKSTKGDKEEEEEE